MAPRFSKAWNEEFETLKEMQEDRMAMHANITCHERCISHYMTNNILLMEKTCMDNCLWKHQQAGVITSMILARFEEMEAKRPAKKK